MLIVVAGKLQYGDVPKRLKGPHSKCGRSGNRRESSNLSISAQKEYRRNLIFCDTLFFLLPPLLSLCLSGVDLKKLILPAAISQLRSRPPDVL